MNKKVEREILLISNELFKTKLENQISKGRDFIENTNDDLNRLKDEKPPDLAIKHFTNIEKSISLWIDYNSEFLKSVFNPPFNEYKKEFDSAEDFRREPYTYNWSDKPFSKLHRIRITVRKKLYILEKFHHNSELLHSVSRNNALLIDRLIDNETVNEIKTLISKGFTREAIEYLLDYMKSKSEKKLLNEVVLLAGQFSKLEIDERILITTGNEAKVERNRINKSLLDIVDKI